MRYRAEQIIARLMLDHGQNSGEDQLRQWFESVYAILRSLPWTWNFQKYYGSTIAPVALVETYTFTNGSATIIAAVASTATASYTGRYIFSDDQWFRVDKAGDPNNPNNIVLDRAYMGTTTAGVSVTLVRGERAFKSSGIRNVRCDSVDLVYRSSEQLHSSHRGNSAYIYDTPAQPAGYYIDKEREIPAPVYKPHITNTGMLTGPTAGEYEYFFTYYDVESGLESPPGPRTMYTGANGKQLLIGYRTAVASATNVGEKSYQLRLWRSRNIVKQTRYPMWLVATKVSLNHLLGCGDSFVDDDLVTRERYYDGPYDVLTFVPAPDDVYQLFVLHTDQWGARIDNDDIIDLGPRQEMLELISWHFSYKQGSMNRKLSDQASALAAFEQRLRMLQVKDSDGELDQTSWEHHEPTPFVASPFDSDDDFDESFFRFPF